MDIETRKKALSLSQEQTLALMRVLLVTLAAWPDCMARLVSYAELVQRLPKLQQVPPDILGFYVIRLENLEYLRMVSREGSTFQVGGLTRNGKRLAHKKYSPYGGLALKGALALLSSFLYILLMLWMSTRR